MDGKSKRDRYYDIIGLASSGASVNINGSSAGVERKGEYFRKELQVNNTSAQYPAVAVEASDGVNTGGPISGHLFVPPATESCTHDEDGNLAQDGRWDYTWDAENRLVKLESRSNAPGGSARRIEFGYDWRGRRVWRKVTNLGDNSVEERKYIYDGWNLYAEFDGNGALVQSYVWGPDLSGDAPSRQQRAGGVGGLVGVKPAGAAIHFVAYDGNGNVAGLVDGSTGAISAWYEYGPFGEPIRVSGAMAKLNPFRFSTKYTDDESGFLYYGYRYYNPETGRWLTPDPIGELGGLNLYQPFFNAPTTFVDRNGLDNIYVTPENIAALSIQNAPVNGTFTATAIFKKIYTPSIPSYQNPGTIPNYQQASTRYEFTGQYQYSSEFQPPDLIGPLIGGILYEGLQQAPYLVLTEGAGLVAKGIGGCFKAAKTPTTVDRLRNVAQQGYDYAVQNPRVQGLNRMQLGKDAEVQATRWMRRWAERNDVNLGPGGLQFQVRGANSVPDVVFDPARQTFDFKLTPRAVRPSQTQNFGTDFPGYNIEYIFGL